MKLHYLLLPSFLLSACTSEKESKTAVFLTIAPPGGIELTDYADSIWIYVDPEIGAFVDIEGNSLPEGNYTTSVGMTSSFGDFIDSDDDLELGIRISLED